MLSIRPFHPPSCCFLRELALRPTGLLRRFVLTVTFQPSSRSGDPNSSPKARHLEHAVKDFLNGSATPFIATPFEIANSVKAGVQALPPLRWISEPAREYRCEFYEAQQATKNSAPINM